MASNDKTFYYYFKENMDAMGLDAPNSLFNTLAMAVGTTATLISAAETAGKSMTVAQAFKTAGWSSKSLGYSGAILLSYYVGGCLGSLTVAATKTYSNFATRAKARNKSFNFDEPEFYSVSDISAYAKRYKIAMSHNVQKTLHRNPELCKNHVN